MDCEYRLRLDAYHDRELDAAESGELERHLEICPACAQDLAEIREVSRAFEGMAREDISGTALRRAHAAADASVPETGAPILRVAGLLTGLAASVLVIASAWLSETSAVVDPPRQRISLPALAPEWERVAMTLQAGPFPGEPSDTSGQQMLADARLADWMLRNLEAGGR